MQPITFQASYAFGPDIERLGKKNKVADFIQTNFVRLFKYFIYPGASFLKSRFSNPVRIQQAKEKLISVGGEVVKLKTPDGDVIEGMYLNASVFKSKISKYCDLIEEDNYDGTKKQILAFKDEYCALKSTRFKDKENYSYMKLTPEAQSFFNLLDNFGIEVDEKGEVPETNIKRPLIKLGNVPVDLPLMNTDTDHGPTCLISGGSAVNYPAYKSVAASYLLRGINVMMIDFRGYAQNDGSPTAHKTKLDVETAYQYLVEMHGVKNNQLIVHGHCLGGGPAADLAARRPGINLLLDRSFAEFRETALNQWPRMRSIIYHLLPWVVNYNNAENVSKIKGSVAIVKALQDDTISPDQIDKLIDSLPNTVSGKTAKLIHSLGEHTGSWANYPGTVDEFNQFLEQIHLRRRLF